MSAGRFVEQYHPYETAAPLDQQHVTRIQLRPSVGTWRYEYAFPDGLTTTECDDLCPRVVGKDGLNESDAGREWIVTGTLAGMLRADGVSLDDHVVDFVHGQPTTVDLPFYKGDSAVFEPVAIVPGGPPVTLHSVVRERGWRETATWLRSIHDRLRRYCEDIWTDCAVWAPMTGTRLPWEPVIVRLGADGRCLRLAVGTEAAAYEGRRVELVVSAAERGDWMSDKDAARMTDMSKAQWRRWIETNRDVRVGRPIASNGQPARNRRLIHRGDLRRASGWRAARTRTRRFAIRRNAG